MSFSVPGKDYAVLPIDFYEQESFERIIESLEKLEKVFDSLMQTIEGKVSEFHDRVGLVSKRIESAASRVSHMEGSTKGYMIKSCPTFPKTALSPIIHFPLEHAVPKSEQAFHVNDTFGNPPSVGDMQGRKEDVKMVTKLLCQLGVPASRLLDTRSNHELLGLGEMRESVSSLTSLFIFNTKSNAYQTVVSEMNPEMAVHQLQNAGLANMPDAKPLTSQDPLSHVKQEFNFQPDAGQALNVQMPTELPLSGIAQLDWDDDDDDDAIFMPGAAKAAPAKRPQTPPKAEELPSLPNLPSLPGSSPQQPPAPKAPELKMPAISEPVAKPSAPSLVLPPASKPPPAPALVLAPASKAPAAPALPVLSAPSPSAPKDIESLPKPADPSAREALLDSLRSSNPLARLRPTKTKEPPKPGQMNAMDLLKNQVKKRFEAIHETEVEVAPRAKPPPAKKKTDIEISSSDDSD